MKGLRARVCSSVLVFLLVLSLVPSAYAATYDYAVEGGNLKFDPTTGTITDCDTSVYSADIPSEIYGVPVTTIGRNAFANCTKLGSVVVPEGVTKIETGAFNKCSQLTSVALPQSLEEISDRGSVISYTNGIFYGCTSLETIVIPGGVKSVPKYTFYGCTSLKNVTLCEGIEELGERFFEKCSSLESITLPDSVKSVDKYLFSDCKALTTVTFGSGLKSMGDYAISNCDKLSAVYFRGDAPSANQKIINKFADGFKIYYPEGASGWTSPTWNGYITEAYTPVTESPAPEQPPVQPQQPPVQPQAPSGQYVTAIPTASTVLVNGNSVSFEAYNINGSNYFKLRDLALILSGSKAQFNVIWDGNARVISLISGQPYTPVGGEMSGKGTINKVAQANSSTVLVNGVSATFTAYTIDGSNYFKLRDLGETFDFGVDWDSAANAIVIDTSKGYTPD